MSRQRSTQGMVNVILWRNSASSVVSIKLARVCIVPSSEIFEWHIWFSQGRDSSPSVRVLATFEAGIYCRIQRDRREFQAAVLLGLDRWNLMKQSVIVRGINLIIDWNVQCNLLNKMLITSADWLTGNLHKPKIGVSLRQNKTWAEIFQSLSDFNQSRHRRHPQCSWCYN